MKFNCQSLSKVFALALSDAKISEVRNIYEHPRVVAAAAFLFAAVRILRRERGIALPYLLDEALPISLSLIESWPHAQCAFSHRVLLHHIALAKSVESVVELGFPPGYDGSDSPEQMVIFALAVASLPRQNMVSLLRDLKQQKGVGDIVVPIVVELAQLRYGIKIDLAEKVTYEAVKLIEPAEQLALC